MPNTSERAAAASDTSSESRSAVHAPVDESWSIKCDHGARIRSAAIGTTMNATPIAARTPIARGVRRHGEVRIGRSLC